MSDKKNLPEHIKRAASNLGIAWEAEIDDSEEESPQWDPDAWDGLTEEEAFESDPDAVIEKMGKVIASQTWRGGSWAFVTEYNGRYFSTDEVEREEFDNAADAFSRAGIGRDTFDEIMDLSISPKYEDPEYSYSRLIHQPL